MKRFDLRKALEDWTRQLRRHPGFEDADMLEVSQHIQDRVEHLLIEGWTEEQAFQKAVQEFGSLSEIGKAFGKGRRPSGFSTWFFFLLPGWLKTFYRTSIKNSFYQAISIFSLAASIATALVIYKLFVFEYSFDRHFSEHRQIYRLEASFYQGGEWISSANNSWYAGEVVQENLAGIEAVVRITPGRSTFLQGEEEVFEKNLLVTSENFFQLFDLEFIEGDISTAFTQKQAIVLTENMASRYFGTEPAVGKVLTPKNGDRSLTVTGVVKEIPPNTHFHGDALVNIEGFRDLYQAAFFKNPGWTSCFTYVKLGAGVNPTTLVDQFPSLISTHLGSTFSVEDTKFSLRPLTAIHLQSKSGEELSANGNLSQLKFLGVMALLILILAILNYANLSTAGYSSRLREMAVRKIIGANRLQIFLQFLSESLIHFQIALLLGGGFIFLAGPLLEGLIPFADIWHFTPTEIVGLIGFSVLLALITGTIPAFTLSQIRPKSIFITQSRRTRAKPLLRRGLVTFQFMITAGMFIATAAIYHQYQFLRTYDRGYKVESVLAVPKYNMAVDRYEAMKEVLLAHSNISAIGASSLVFPGALQSSINYRTTENPDEKKSMKAVRTDRDFFRVFDMQFKQGEGYTLPYQVERPEVILNEKAVQLLSWENTENKWFEPLHLEEKAAVAGVAKDINFESLHNDIIPVVYLHDPANAHIMYLRLGKGAIAPTLAFIQDNFQDFTDNRFEHWFVEEKMLQQYAQEKAFTKVFAIFTLIAIIIAFAGLYGLSRFVCERRTKEIGIRKILGATAPQVLWQMLKGFFFLALLAFLLVTPLASLTLRNWLSNFAYHISVDASIILQSLLAILMLSTTAVIYQVVKVANGNPVKALRYE